MTFLLTILANLIIGNTVSGTDSVFDVDFDIWHVATALEPPRFVVQDGFLSIPTGASTISEVFKGRMPKIVSADVTNGGSATFLWKRELFTNWTVLLGDILSLEQTRVCSLHARDSTFLLLEQNLHSGLIQDIGDIFVRPRASADITVDEVLSAAREATEASTACSQPPDQTQSISSEKNIRRYLFQSNYRVFEDLYGVHESIRWRDLLYEEPIAHYANISVNMTAPVLTIISPATAVQAAYSEYHTMRTQLVGSGTYYLFAPKATASSLYLYPSIHSAHRQSQIPMDASDESLNNVKTLFPKFKETTTSNVFKVIVTEGQVLYIPPYWSVRAEYADLSVVLDVLSPSHKQMSALEAFSITLPFKKTELDALMSRPGSDAVTVRVQLAQIYLVQFLSRVAGLPSPKALAKALYAQRFQQLFPLDSAFMMEGKNELQCTVLSKEHVHHLLRK